MEELLSFASQFLSSSIGLPNEAEQLFQKLHDDIEKQFATIEPAVLQKNKKAKQMTGAGDSSQTRENRSKKIVPASSTSTTPPTEIASPKEPEDKENEEPNKVNDSRLLDSSTASLRPVRTRKNKNATLRESLLSGEIKIKKEKADKPVRAKRTVQSRVSNNTEGAAGEAEEPVRDRSSDSAKKVKLDTSVEVIQKPTDTVVLSDDDEVDKMPPPAVPAPKSRNTRTKKASTAQPLIVKVKEEPVDTDMPKRSTRSKAIKPVEETPVDPTYGKLVPKVRMSTMDNTSQVATETSVGNTAREREKTKVPAKTTKSKAKSKKPAQIVENNSDSEAVVNEGHVEEEGVATGCNEDDKGLPSDDAATQKEVAKKSTKKVSAESVYEDAQNDPKIFASSLVLEKVVVPSNLVPQREAIKEEENNINNETFVSASSSAAAAPISAAAFPQLDSTFNVAPKEMASNKVEENGHSDAPPAMDSIMTEDLSTLVLEHEVKKETTPKKCGPPLTSTVLRKTPVSLKKNNHEIFNPFIQSPVKSKVDAYERHVKESKIPVTPKYVPQMPSALSQPLPVRVKGTPSHGNSHQSALTTTTSDLSGNKLKQMKKALGMKTATSTSSLASSDSARGTSSVASSSLTVNKQRTATSADDPKRVGLQWLQKAEDAKKKREEKQRMAMLNREKLDLKKKEQMAKAVQDREARAIKLMQEKSETALMEKKNQAMARMAMENSQQKKIKEMQMKQKALMKQQSANGYNWDLLVCCDSTDDEDKGVKLPDPPEWSRRPLRTKLIAEQSAIPSYITDDTFGIQPMSPDLREIFPDIDPKLLKRNSSMIWKTPPRFSRIERPV